MVEGTGLENRQALAGLVGSNPTPSATYSISEGICKNSVRLESVRQEITGYNFLLDKPIRL